MESAETETRLDEMRQLLTEIAATLNQLTQQSSTAISLTQAVGVAEKRLIRASHPLLPDARFVRRIIRQRQLRARYFDAELFADPAWDMLLDLAASRVEHRRVSVTSLCIASGVPPTTALRWIGQLEQMGLFKRVEDETDRRRSFIELSDKATRAIAQYFADLGSDARTYF